MSRKRAEPLILACVRTADLPEPRTLSDKGACMECGAPIWVAQSSPEAAIELCLSCATPYMDDEGAEIGPLTQRQLDDIIRHRRKRWH